MMLEPRVITDLYYKSLYSGDLDTVKAFMTEDSYMLTLESFGLRLSFKDEHFKKLLNEIEESTSSLREVETLLSKDLSSREQPDKIEIIDTVVNGDTRQTVNYKEGDKVKKLYFSKESDGWKINFYAGRKVN